MPQICAQNIIGTHLPSICDIGEVRWLQRAQMASVQPAVVWQKIQRYLLPEHQTTEQFSFGLFRRSTGNYNLYFRVQSCVV